MYEVIECLYKDLPKEIEGMSLPDNGSGKKYARYIVEKYDGEIISVNSDAMEREDATFGRDLKWIKGSLENAYRLGIKDGAFK